MYLMKTLQHHCGQITAHRSHITEARTTRMHLMKTVQHHCGRIRARPRTGRVGVGGEGCLSLLLYTTLLTTGVLLYTLLLTTRVLHYNALLLKGALYFLRQFILYFFTASIGVSGVPVCYFTLCFLQGLPLYTLLLNLAFNCVLVEAIPN